MKSTDRFLVDGVVCALHGHALPVSNLSVGGLFAATPTPPPPDEFLELDLTLPGRPPFRVLGKVAWVNEVKAPRAPDLPQGFGFKILRIALADKIAILDFLKRAAPRIRKGSARAR